MSIDVEYRIKQDIRNNPVLREVDARQSSELRRTVWLAVLALAMVLFSAWQHYQTRETGMRIEDLRLDRAREDVMNRQLRLNLETQRSPQDIERRARELGLIQATPQETLIVERASSAPPSGSVFAHLH